MPPVAPIRRANGSERARWIRFLSNAPYLTDMSSVVSRRSFLKLGATTVMLASSGTAWAQTSEDGLSPDLMSQAMKAFQHHRDRLTHVDRIGIVDFSRPSSSPRLFIIDAEKGKTQSYLVAHGRGSDPAHTGWARRFSNEPGSNASSTGAFVTGPEYSGQHGRSLRLIGLDAENCNAESRAIVVHAASYVTPELALRTGMLGRSQGCFAVSITNIHQVIDRLGPGRMLYAAKIEAPQLLNFASLTRRSAFRPPS
jgi:hypothetical protein